MLWTMCLTDFILLVAVVDSLNISLPWRLNFWLKKKARSIVRAVKQKSVTPSTTSIGQDWRDHNPLFSKDLESKNLLVIKSANLHRNASSLIRINFTMQQNNDPEQTTDTSKHGASKSPDLNPTEHELYLLKRRQTTTEKNCSASLRKPCLHYNNIVLLKML